MAEINEAYEVYRILKEKRYDMYGTSEEGVGDYAYRNTGESPFGDFFRDFGFEDISTHFLEEALQEQKKEEELKEVVIYMEGSQLI